MPALDGACDFVNLSCAMSAVQFASSSLLPLPLLPGIPSLHYLSQASNALMSVPPAVGGYSQLAVLDLAGNAIEVLPDELGQLIGGLGRAERCARCVFPLLLRPFSSQPAFIGAGPQAHECNFRLQPQQAVGSGRLAASLQATIPGQTAFLLDVSCL